MKLDLPLLLSSAPPTTSWFSSEDFLRGLWPKFIISVCLSSRSLSARRPPSPPPPVLSSHFCLSLSVFVLCFSCLVLIFPFICWFRSSFFPTPPFLVLRLDRVVVSLLCFWFFVDKAVGYFLLCHNFTSSAWLLCCCFSVVSSSSFPSLSSLCCCCCFTCHSPTPQHSLLHPLPLKFIPSLSSSASWERQSCILCIRAFWTVFASASLWVSPFHLPVHEFAVHLTAESKRCETTSRTSTT